MLLLFEYTVATSGSKKYMLLFFFAMRSWCALPDFSWFLPDGATGKCFILS